jgi:hypothetical protein
MKSAKEIVADMEKPHAQVSPEAYARFKDAVNKWWASLPEEEKSQRAMALRRSNAGETS